MDGSLSGLPDCKPLLKHNTEIGAELAEAMHAIGGSRHDLASVASEKMIGAGNFASACTVWPRLSCKA
jgi:hypothetical protein